MTPMPDGPRRIAQLFPLRDDHVVSIEVPFDLTHAEVDRLTTWVRTLVIAPRPRALEPQNLQPVYWDEGSLLYRPWPPAVHPTPDAQDVPRE